jgi:hypothetical protein
VEPKSRDYNWWTYKDLTQKAKEIEKMNFDFVVDKDEAVYAEEEEPFEPISASNKGKMVKKIP